MQTANRTINVPPGATALVGRTTAIPAPGAGNGGGTPSAPLWVRNSGVAVNKIVAIPNTAGFGGATLNYSCWAIKRATSELFSAAAGGHTNSSDNRVVGLRLLDDAPGWAIRTPGGTPSTVTAPDVAYYPDGKPVSRHLYQMLHHVAATDRLILVGCRFGYQTAVNHNNVDTFDLTTNQWDGAGYNADVGGVNGGGVTDYDGDVWYGIFVGKYLPTTRTWGPTAPGRNSVGTLRHIWATDNVNRQVFGLSWSDGESHYSTDGYLAGVMRNGVVSPVTIAPGAALTRFITERPAYGAMDYDPINDCFVYYDASTNHFYTVSLPYSSNVATMTIYTPDMTTYTPTPPNIDEGVMGRFSYVAALKGFVGGPYTGDLFLLQTSA